MTCPTISNQLGCPGWPHTPKNHFQTASALPAPLPTGHTLHATHRITVNSKEQNARAVLYIHSKTQCFCGTGNAEGPGASAPASQRDARHWDTLVPHPSACTDRSIPSSSHTGKNLMCTFRNFKIFILSHKEAEPLSLPTAQPGSCRLPLRQWKACTIFQSCTDSHYFFLGEDQYLQSVLNHCFSSASSSVSAAHCQQGTKISELSLLQRLTYFKNFKWKILERPSLTEREIY